MLFLCHYEIDVEHLESAMAKRIEWDNMAPETCRIVCEYTVHGQPPPFGGFMVVETDEVDDLNFMVMYYGKSVRMNIRPCSDVLTAMKMTRRNLDESQGR